MRYSLFSYIHPSGYELDKSNDLVPRIMEEKAEMRQIDVKGLINDIYQAFKLLKKEDENTLFSNPLFSVTHSNFDTGERSIALNEKGIERLINLVNKYGLVKAPRLMEISKPYGSWSHYQIESMKEQLEENGIALNRSIKESLDPWNTLIENIMNLDQTTNLQSLEITNINLSIDSVGNILLKPLDLITAIDCHTFKQGIGLCSWCNSPFVQRRSNNNYCNKSCKASAGRKRRENKQKNMT